MNRQLIFRLALSVMGLVFMLHSPASPAQAPRPQAKQQQVQIYLARQSSKDTDPYDPKNPGGLRPVNRMVNRVAPLRAALTVLLAGPSAAEESQGYIDIGYGIKLVKVAMKNGKVRADFTMPPGAAFPGEGAPFLFSDAVEFTAKQFPGVKKVIVCLDGILDFGSESGEPPKKCPRL